MGRVVRRACSPNGYAATDSPARIGNQEFVNDEVALSYTGVWNADAVAEEVGDDLVILPPPDFGNGPKIGGGSWQWGMSSATATPPTARGSTWSSADPKYIAEFADKQVVIPAHRAAAEAVRDFAPDGVPDLRRSRRSTPCCARRRRPTRHLGHLREGGEGHHERRRRAGDPRPGGVGDRREHRVERRLRLLTPAAGGGPGPRRRIRSVRPMTVTPPTVVRRGHRHGRRRPPLRGIQGGGTSGPASR